MPKIKKLEQQGNITNDIANSINVLLDVELTKLTTTELTAVSDFILKIQKRLEQRKESIKAKELEEISQRVKELGYKLVAIETDTVIADTVKV